MRFASAVIALMLASSSGSARAEEKKDAGPSQTSSEEPKASAPSQMSPEEQAMMEKYMKAAEPGPHHQKLAKLAGQWKLAVTSWMAPGAPPQKSDGTAEFKTLFGGRYLEENVHGSMGGQPFEGKGLQGFDNVTQEGFGTWVDGMTTSLFVMRGKCPVEAQKCTYKGMMSDPLSGKPVPASQIISYTDDDHFKFELRGPGPGGKPFKMLEILYTRQ